MATGTPFHPRTAALSTSQAWTQWSGFFSASSYGDFVQPEYAAIRNATAVIDVSPLYKYEVSGPDARALLDRVVTQDVSKLGVRQALYTPWCDPDGMVRQEGTLFRTDDERYQLNAAEPALGWLGANLASGEQVEIADRSAEVAVLSVQGPTSRDVLGAVGSGAVGELGFFRLASDTIAGVPVTISRTGYTGDLGYEVWLPAERALDVWDALFAGGEAWGITACGLDAMDIARLETGFILINVDYASSELALFESDKASPYTLGLGWSVKLDKGPFVGRQALAREKAAGTTRRVVGLEVPWAPLEAVYLGAGMMPDLPLATCREPVPIYARNGGPQIGRTTTRVWSTLLKKFIALGTVDDAHAAVGNEIELEVTVHYERRRVPATVTKTPFFRPPRMRA